ncbi:YqeG family HAD IIIA-type phosphatase [Candidatus Bipolaricaulota bacterium]
MIPRLFRPNETTESVFAIDYDRLWDAGMRVLMFDLDKTLVSWQGKSLPQATKSLLDSLAERGFRIAILSNRRPRGNEPSLLSDVRFPMVQNAGKPRARAFRALLNRLQASADETVMIGDRYLTDVLGGNRVGLHTIRVSRFTEDSDKDA